MFPPATHRRKDLTIQLVSQRHVEGRDVAEGPRGRRVQSLAQGPHLLGQDAVERLVV